MIYLFWGLVWRYPAPFLALLVFLAWADWFKYLGTLGPRERELAKASHGVGVMMCGAYLLYTAPVPQQYQKEALGVYAGLFCLGAAWLFIGSARAQIYGDVALLTRASLKFCFGWVVWLAWWYFQPGIPLDLRAYLPAALVDMVFAREMHFDLRIVIAPVLMLVSIWCWSTGVVQILICSRRLPRFDGGGNPGSHGRADFGSGGGLRG